MDLCYIFLISEMFTFKSKTNVTCHDGGPAGGADGVADVPVGEPHSCSGHIVDESGLLDGMSVRCQITDAHVVRDHEDDVGPVERSTIATARASSATGAPCRTSMASMIKQWFKKIANSREELGGRRQNDGGEHHGEQ